MFSRQFNVKLVFSVSAVGILFVSGTILKMDSLGTPALHFYDDVMLLVYFVFIAFIMNSGLRDEIKSNRIKLWLSLPISRWRYFAGLFWKTWFRSFLILSVWFLLLSILQYLFVHQLPHDILLVGIGAVQLATVSVLLLTCCVHFIPGELTLPIMVVLPWSVHLISVQAEKGQSVINTIIQMILPINSGYNNILCGISNTLQFTASKAHINLFSIIWIVLISGILLYRTRYTEY